MNAMENVRLDTMEKGIKILENKVDQILVAIKGDEYGLSGGLVNEIKAIKEKDLPLIRSRIAKLETLKNKVIWMSVGAGITGGVGIVKVIQWIQEAAK